jgi:hypothetical protein
MKANRPPSANHRGDASAKAVSLAAIEAQTEAGRSTSSTIRDRRWRSIRGMSILTGQASRQAPQSDEANGRAGAASIPISSGVRIDPIGP